MSSLAETNGKSVQIQIKREYHSERDGVLGASIVATGKAAKEYCDSHKVRWRIKATEEEKKQAEKIIQERIKDCALAIADYCQGLADFRPTEISIGIDPDFGYPYYESITSFERGVWRDLARTLRTPEKASAIEAWFTISTLRDKARLYYEKYQRAKDPQGEENFLYVSAAYSYAEEYLTGGNTNDGALGMTLPAMWAVIAAKTNKDIRIP